jgi:MerR family mercuric resistance operon transcriptional regulator
MKTGDHMKYRISQLAKVCNINKETIRYYERLGLIPEPTRSDSGYRMYPEDMVQRIGFIKRMQDLGFTLQEIDKLLGIADRDEVKCKDMYEFTVFKLREIQSKIQDLRKIERMLIRLKEKCPENKEMFECPIIETLMER